MAPARRDAAEPAPRNAWRAVLVALLLVVGVAAAWSHLIPRPPSPAVPPTETPTPTPTVPEIARREVWTSDTPASGEYRANTVAPAPAIVNPRVVDYVVKVETSVPGIDPDAAAREIQATFDDPRGWAGYGKTSFRTVVDETDAALVIVLASPDSAQELCEPADIDRKWNCRVANRVVVNTDRWLYMTPTYDELAEYRAYLINHEVGHYLGLGHVGCPGVGERAPVMMQQSIDLGGCVRNAWPRESD